MKILFLHGWHSAPDGLHPAYLVRHGHEVITPKLPDDDFEEAVRIARDAFDKYRPDVVVGLSRGGTVAMNITSGEAKLVLLCPGWKRWGTARTVKPATVILHSRADDVVPFAYSEELVRNSGLPSTALIEVGGDHWLADPESLAAMLRACEGSHTTSPGKAGSEERMNGPSPNDPHPMAGFPQVGFLKPLVTNPNIVVGEYTYYDDPDGPEHFEAKCVLYHYPFVGDKLILGKFCALARGVRFIMNGANHKVSGFSTYPFQIFGNGWEAVMPQPGDLPYKGDTVVGNDVWLGYDVLVMPGVKIGDGAVIAARAVVTRDVPPYAVVGGNPARVVKQRFPDEVVAELLAIRWWDWPVEKITRNLHAVVGADLDVLRNAT